MSRLPDSLPIHHHARNAFHGLNVPDVSRCYSTVAQQLLETYQQTIDDPEDDVDAQMNELISTYQELVALELSSRSLEAKLANAKGKYRESTQTMDPVNLESWSHYTKDDPEGPTPLSQLFESEQVPLEKGSRQTREDKLLWAIAHLWKDPTAMMPDDQNNDEDIHIEGGKIELRCPITCQDFKQPMISKKCSHVFDLQGLENYFQGHAARDCPQAGCSQKLSMNDFEQDQIMALRCQLEKVKRKIDAKPEIALDVI